VLSKWRMSGIQNVSQTLSVPIAYLQAHMFLKYDISIAMIDVIECFVVLDNLFDAICTDQLMDVEAWIIRRRLQSTF
jgi:hypothetical protein